MSVWSGQFNSDMYPAQLFGLLPFVQGRMIVRTDGAIDRPGVAMQAFMSYSGLYRHGTSLVMTLKCTSAEPLVYEAAVAQQTLEFKVTHRGPDIMRGMYTSKSPQDVGTFTVTLEKDRPHGKPGPLDDHS